MSFSTFSIRFLDVNADLVKQLIEWQRRGENRTIEIEFEPISRNEGEQMLQIWCFDTDSGCGSYITKAEELQAYEDICKGRDNVDCTKAFQIPFQEC